MTGHNCEERPRAVTASIVADVLETHPLPTTVEASGSSDRRRLKDAACAIGITPAALLRRRHADRTCEATKTLEIAALHRGDGLTLPGPALRLNPGIPPLTRRPSSPLAPPGTGPPWQRYEPRRPSAIDAEVGAEASYPRVAASLGPQGRNVLRLTPVLDVLEYLAEGVVEYAEAR